MKIRWKTAFRLMPGLAAALLAAAYPAGSQTSATPRQSEVAPGIYLFQSPDHGYIGVEGNSYAIVNESDVFVFDANQAPSTAQQVIDAIRQITPRPVRYVANSHWHYDHWLGNEAYAKAFPGVEIIASDAAREIMQEVTSEYIQHELPGSNEQAHKVIGSELESGKNSAGQSLTDENRREMQQKLSEQAPFVAELAGAHPTLPTLTYDHRLTIFHGGREFRVMKFVGNTPGDTAMYLPQQKILFTGDLLVYPIPYAFNSYPQEWIQALAELDHMDATLILPGHGEPQHDKKYLELVLAAMQSVVEQVRKGAAEGKRLEDIQKSVKLDSADQFTHGDAHAERELQAYFLGPLTERAYKEARGEI
jgi:cyclase